MARSKSRNPFRVEPGRTYAVLTGDIVGSSRLDPKQRRAVPDLLERAGRLTLKTFPAAAPLPLAIFGGDSWQLLVAEPGGALRIGLLIRASLRAAFKGLDTRVAIGLGPVDFVPGGDVARAEGEAFRLSGRLLAELGKRARMGFESAAGSRRETSAWSAAVRLLDAVIQRQWTPPRSLAVRGAICGLKQDQIARLWEGGIEQASVSKHLSLAQWELIEQVVAAFQAAWKRT